MKVMAFGLLLASVGWTQSGTDQNPAPDKTMREQKQERGAAGEIGSGAANIGTGAGKGAADVGKGTAKGAVSLATLHPIDAGASVGKGAASAGKNVSVGTAKGTGKIAKGVGKAFKKIF